MLERPFPSVKMETAVLSAGLDLLGRRAEEGDEAPGASP